MSTKDLLIPLAVAFLPLIWKGSAWFIRRWQFRSLILREIEEIGPYPRAKIKPPQEKKEAEDQEKDEKQKARDAWKQAREKKEDDLRQECTTWTQHHSQKKFVHREILMKPTENRDFILSLPASLVYYVTQLWQSTDDADQWIYMLSQIENEVPWYQKKRRQRIKEVKESWCRLLQELNIPFDPDLCDRCPEVKERDKTDSAS